MISNLTFNTEPARNNLPCTSCVFTVKCDSRGGEEKQIEQVKMGKYALKKPFKRETPDVCPAHLSRPTLLLTHPTPVPIAAVQ